MPHIPSPTVRSPEQLVGVSEGTMPTGRRPQPGACWDPSGGREWQPTEGLLSSGGCHIHGIAGHSWGSSV